MENPDAAPLRPGKLAAPDLQHLLRRGRLTDRVTRTPAGGACLVSAPQGYGKTVLLADATAGDAVAWVSLDRYDTDVSRFWRHVLAALEPWRTGLPVWPVTATDAARSRFFDAFLAMLADGEPLWLVLDGVAPGLHATWLPQVEHLLGWLPPQLRLAITTRGSLDEIVLTSRLRGLLATLDERDLAYTRAELDQVVAGTLPAEGVAAIHELTAGWPGAVAALVHAAGRDDGDALLDRACTEAPEIILGPWIDGLALRVRSFLLETAHLDVLRPCLCDAVRERDDSAGILLGLAVEARLCSRSPEGERYDRHPMLTLLVRSRAAGLPDNAVRHRRAAAWFADHGDPFAQLHHLLEAGDTDAAARLLDTHVDPLLASARAAEALEWYQRFPRQVHEGRAEGLLRLAWSAVLTGDRQSADVAAHEIEVLLHGMEPAARLTGAVHAQWEQGCAELALLQANLAFHRGDALRQATEACRARQLFGPVVDRNGAVLAPLLEAQALLCLGDTDGARRLLDPLADAPMPSEVMAEVSRSWALADLALVDGRVHEASALLTRARRWLDAHPETPAYLDRYLVRPGLVAVHLELGDVAAARAELVVDGESLTRTSNVTVAVRALVLTARIDHADEQHRQALLRLAEARQRVLRESPGGGLLGLVNATEARLRLTVGDALRADRLLRGMPAGNERALLRARLALARRSSTAAELAGIVQATAPRHIAERELLLAGAQRAARPTTTEGHLLALGDVAAEHGLLLALLDAPDAVVELAESAAVRRGHDGLAALVATARRPWRGTYADATPSRASLQHLALSPGELELLSMLPTRAGNAEIAASLSVSVNTVKTRLRRLYSKLDVHGRDAAVGRARELGLC